VKLPRSSAGLLFSILSKDFRFRRRRHHLRSRAAGEADATQLALIDFLWDVTSAIGYSGMFAAMEALMRTLILSADVGEPYRLGRAVLFYYAGKMVAGEGKREEFVDGLETARKLFREAGDPAPAQVMMALAQSQASFLMGRYRDSLVHARQGTDAIRNGVHGMNWELSTLRLTTLWNLYMLGRYEDVRIESESLAEDARLHGDLFTQTNVGVASMPLVLLAQDKPEAARRCNEEHIAGWPYKGFTLQHMNSLETSMLILLYEGRQQEALDLLERSRSELRRLIFLGHAVITEFFLTLEARCHLGLAAASRERTRHLRAAAKLGNRIRRVRTAHSEAAACGILGSVAYLRGQDQEGARLMQKSVEGFDALGMEMHANTARLRQAERLGSAGRRLLAEAEVYIARENIVAPEAMARMWMM
jgi:hypothetical protein